MLEDVEFCLRGSIARDPQYIMRFHGAVGHDGAKLDGLVANALGRRIVAEQGGDHVGNDPDTGCRRAAIFCQPQVEQTVVERGNGCRLLVHRRIGNHDVIACNSARREEFDIMRRRVGGIADRQCHDADIARYQHACGAFHRRVGAGALKRVAVKVVYMCRTIQADRDRDIARLEAVQPFIVDQHAVGRDRDRYFAACSR